MQKNYYVKRGFDHSDLRELKEQLKKAKKEALKNNDMKKIEECAYLIGVVETLDGIPQNYFDKHRGVVPESCMKYIFDVSKNAKVGLRTAMQRLGWNPQTYLMEHFCEPYRSKDSKKGKE